MACSTDSESEAWLTFFWDIENFSYCWQKRDECIRSPEFKIESIETFSWTLNLYPRGRKDENFISFLIQGTCDDESKIIQVECELVFLDKNGSVMQINTRKRNNFQEGVYLSSEEFSRRKDETNSKSEDLKSWDILRTRCRLWRTDRKARNHTTFSARTILSVKRRHFLWRVEEFSTLESGYTVPYIIRLESDELVINIEVDENDEIIIWMKSYETNVIFFKFQPFITAISGKNIECEHCEIFSDEFKNDIISTLPFTKTHLINNKHLYLRNDVLSLYCESSWADEYNHSEIERIDSIFFRNRCMSDTEVRKLDCMADLKEDFECLYIAGIHSDVKLRTATQTFHTHKSFLSARSPVFRKMFETDMKEKIQECVDIPDLEDDTVRRMLQYVYTNALKDLEWKSVLKLYAAADKYEILTLKGKCSSYLKSNLCPCNLCDVLVLADMHVDGDLKDIAQDYALKYEADVFPLDEWIEFTKTHPILAAETMLLKWRKANN
ncbi:TD and POZ domain-containing protein 1 [Nephila pilipes]|uniref:TD and POZ domain-containing protein 1 n=1 Tax=Nephila pilipes TaxID=299642 RepID=A0A8X6T2Z2_NEPPI|nr:TD and POZ domain-containing protein 1 [Nephila pilipes]